MPHELFAHAKPASEDGGCKMSQGRSLRLFLVDGTPNGLLTAKIMDWPRHVLTSPRSKLAEQGAI